LNNGGEERQNNEYELSSNKFDEKDHVLEVEMDNGIGEIACTLHDYAATIICASQTASSSHSHPPSHQEEENLVDFIFAL